MKNFLFALALLISAPSFSQVTVNPGPIDTNAVDTPVTQTPPAVTLFLRVRSDGSVDSLWVPAGGSIGDFTPTTKEQYSSAFQNFLTLLWAAIISLLVLLSSWFKGIGKLKLPDNKKYTVAGMVVMVAAGFGVKFQDAGTWLSWALANVPLLPFLSSGIYEWVLKLFRKKTPSNPA